MTPPRRAVVVALLAIATLATPACSSHQPDYPDATVRVEIFSGRENPVVSLDDATASALVAYLDTKVDDALPTLGAPTQLGFSGLVVSLDGVFDAEGDVASPIVAADAAALAPTETIHITPHVIYVTDAMGSVRISDLSGEAFDLVWEAVRPSLELDVVEAVESEV